MILKRVYVKGFRNFDERNFEIGSHTTVIIGENARGKTNLLEAVYFSMNGVGFRETHEDELMQWDSAQALVETTWNEGDSDILFQILLHRRDLAVDKHYYVNKTTKTHSQYAQYLGRAVLFAPEHLDIITGSPEKRRDYANRIIGTYDPEYRKKLRNYEHAMRKRNKILEFHRDAASLREETAFWNEYMREQAAYVTQAREAFVRYLNANGTIEDRVFDCRYVKNEFTEERLERYFELERRTRRTAIGPQKDDFSISVTREAVRKNVHLYGSRSEQRMAVFWLKLNEVTKLEETYHKLPLLLLDDIFSELDGKNKKLVLGLASRYQTVLTTTESELLEISDVPQTVIRL